MTLEYIRNFVKNRFVQICKYFHHKLSHTFTFIVHTILARRFIPHVRLLPIDICRFATNKLKQLRKTINFNIVAFMVFPVFTEIKKLFTKSLFYLTLLTRVETFPKNGIRVTK